LNKVAGNFHIAAGKSVPLMRGHAHLTTLFDDNQVTMLSGHFFGNFPLFLEKSEKKLPIILQNQAIFVEFFALLIRVHSYLNFRFHF
jgi:hypothetical protein